MKRSVAHIQMVFIVSRGRSGSTLLQSILDSHSSICAPLESKFVLHLKSKYLHVKKWDEKVINTFLKDLYTNRKIRLFWNIDRNKLISLFSEYQINSYADACKLVYLSFPSVHIKKNVTVIIDKNPAHSRFINELHTVYPKAKFIHLIRDPRATIHSQMKAFNRKSIYNLAELWVFLNNKIVNSFKTLNVENTSLKYEDLVLNPKNEISSLLLFLDLMLEEKMLESHRSIKPLTINNNYLSLPHHQNVGNPINTKSIEKWKSFFNLKTITIINFICAESASKYGYSIAKKSKPSLFQSIKLKLSKARILFNNYMIHLLFNMPFLIRKTVYNTVSLIFDKKYKA